MNAANARAQATDQSGDSLRLSELKEGDQLRRPVDGATIVVNRPVSNNVVLVLDPTEQGKWQPLSGFLLFVAGYSQVIRDEREYSLSTVR